MYEVYTLQQDAWLIAPEGILPEWTAHRPHAWEDTVTETDRATGFHRFVSWATARRTLGYTRFALRIKDAQAYLWET